MTTTPSAAPSKHWVTSSRTYEMVAEELGLSPLVAKVRIHAALERLNVLSTTAAIVLAMQRGLIDIWSIKTIPRPES